MPMSSTRDGTHHRERVTSASAATAHRAGILAGMASAAGAASIPAPTPGAARRAMAAAYVLVGGAGPVVMAAGHPAGTPFVAASLIHLVAAGAALWTALRSVDGRPAGVGAVAVAVAAAACVAVAPWAGLFALVFVASSALLLFPWFVGGAVVAGVLAADALGGAPLYEPVVAVLAIALLWGAPRVVRLVDELQRYRAGSAQSDLLGQSLSAVSFQGDLAAALLERDPRAARAELERLTATARDALRSARRRPAGSAPGLGAELDGARALLGAAGITLTVAVDAVGLAALDEVAGAAVRAGVAAVVRRGDATVAEIATHHTSSRAVLVVRCDGGPAPGPDAGLADLARRCTALGGAVTTTAADGWFDVRVELPRSEADR
jgi:signal transduction histidine kinase